MPSTDKLLKPLAIGAALCASLWATAAAADPIVVKSGGPSAQSFPPGKRLASSGTITLKSGDILTVLDGRGTRTLRGPGTFSTSATASSGSDTRTSLGTLLTTNGARRARTGAVRGGTAAPAKAPRSPNLWYVDISQSSAVCVPDLANIQLWRPQQGQPLKVKVSGAGQPAAVVTFEKNQSLAPWPGTTLPAAEGATYELSWAGLAKPVKIKVAQMEAGSEGLENTASALITKGCEAQLNLLTETVALPDPAPIGG